MGLSDVPLAKAQILSPRGPMLRRFLLGWLEFFTALRYSDFRLFWIGLMGQVTGQQMTIVTLGWLAFHLTGSPLALGIINLLSAAPRIVTGLVGGVFADRFNPRNLIVVAQTTSVAILATLATLTVMDQAAIWHLATAAFLLGLVQSFDEPSRASLFPRLLPNRSLIPLAVPLISVAWSSTRIIAPSIAGFVIAGFGAGISFFIAATGAALMVAMMRLLHVAELPARRSGTMFSNLKEAATYVWGHAEFRPLVVLAFANSTFGLGYMLTLPVFQDVLGVEARGLGLMYSILGIGSMVGLFLYSRTYRRMPAGRMLLVSMVAFAAGLIAFGVSQWFFTSLALLLFIGIVSVIQITTSQVILQTLVADELRGRVMALQGLHWGLLPVGGFIMNGAAEFVGAPSAVAGAGVMLLLVTIWVGLTSTALRRLNIAPAHQQEATPQKT